MIHFLHVKQLCGMCGGDGEVGGCTDSSGFAHVGVGADLKYDVNAAVLREFAQAGTEVKEDMLTFTAMAWGGDTVGGVSLIDLRQKLKDITAQQALLLDQVLEHMDDEVLNAQLKVMMDEKQALQEQIAAAEQSQTHNAAQKSRMAELREWMAKLEVNQQYSDEQVRMAVERITVVDAETIRIRFRYPGTELEKKL